MSPFRFLAFAGLPLLLEVPALAETRASIGLTGGTLGIGPQIGLRTATVGVRADATLLSIHHSLNSSDIDYRGKLELRSAGAALDLYPFKGGFRLSGGGRYNHNRAKAVAMPTRPTEVGGFTFTPAQIGTLSGRARVKAFAPFATLGYGGQFRSGIFFAADAGALFQGPVRLSRFTSSTGLIPQDRLNRERADLEDDIDQYKVYPLVQISVGYRF